MRKRILSFCLALCMMLSLLPTSVLAAETSSTAYGELSVTVKPSMAIAEDTTFTAVLQQDGQTVYSTTLMQADEASDFIGSVDKGIAAGTYTLVVSAPRFLTYTQELTFADDHLQITLYNAASVNTGRDAEEGLFGVMAIGDLNGDSCINDKDADLVSDAIANGQNTYDLNGDGKTDLTDLTYVVRNAGGNTTAPVEKSISQLYLTAQAKASVAESVQVSLKGTESLEEALFSNDTNQTVALAPATEDAVISETYPVDLTLDVEEAVTEPVDAISIAAPLDAENVITAATFTVEGMDGEVYEGTLGGSLESQSTQNAAAPQSDGSLLLTASSIQNDARETKSAAVTQTADGNILINIGTRVAIKKVTIRVTGSTSGKLAEIAKVEFLEDYAERIAPPQLSIPTIQSVSNTPTDGLGFKSLSVSWNKENNVTGYEVKVSGDGFNKTASTANTNHTFVGDSFNGTVKSFQTYQIQVRSVCGDWRSDWSAPYSYTVTCNTKPPAPEQIQVSAGVERLSLSWKPLWDTESWTVYYKKEADSDYQSVQTKTNSCTLSNLMAGQKYLIYAVAQNRNGSSGASSVSVGVPISQQGVKFIQYGMINTNNVDDLATKHIKSISYNGLSVIGTDNAQWAMVDNNPNSYYRYAHWTNDSSNPTITLDKAYTMDTFRFTSSESYPIGSWPGFYKCWVVYKDMSTGNMVQVNANWAYKTDKQGLPYWEVTLSQPITTDTVRIGYSVYPQYNNNLTYAELRLYEYDSLKNDTAALFTNEKRNEVCANVTVEQVQALIDRANTQKNGEYHPDRTNILQDLNYAMKALTEGIQSKPEYTVDTSLVLNRDSHVGMAQSLSDFQPLGYVAAAGDTIVVYVETNAQKRGDTTPVKLMVTQYHGKPEAWQSEYTLKAGRNEIQLNKIGSLNAEAGGSVYVRYTDTANNSYKVTIVSGATQIPVLRVNGLTGEARTAAITQYVEDLKEYVPTVPALHEQLHKNGTNANVQYDYQPTSCILNSTEIVMDYMMYSFPATQVLASLSSGNPVGQLENAIDAMEQEIEYFYQFKGFNKSATDTDRFPVCRLNIRYSTMFTGAFMYAAGKHVGIEYGSVSGLFYTTPVIATEEGKYVSGAYSGWGIAHEIGHCINTAAYQRVEVTNNVYSQLANVNANVETNSNFRTSWSSVYDNVVTGSMGHTGDLAVQLAAYWQLHLAYDDNYSYKFYENRADQMANLFYARVDSILRSGGKSCGGVALTYPVTTTGGDDGFMQVCCAAANKDLLDFFRAWGWKPSDATVAYAAQYEKETRLIQYIDDNSRLYRMNGGEGMSEGTQVQSEITNATASRINGNKVVLTLANSNTNPDALLGYEISRSDGKLVGDTQELAWTVIDFVPATQTSYTDIVTTDNNKAFVYRVTAVDKLLQTSDFTVLPEVKVGHDGSIDKSHWTVTYTNMHSKYYQEECKCENDPDSGVQGNLLTASGHDSMLENLFDNDPYTIFTHENSLWEGNGGTTNRPKITINLGGVKTISAVKLTPVPSDYSGSDSFTNNGVVTPTSDLYKYRPYRYMVEVSTDGVNFTTVKSGEAYSNNSKMTPSDNVVVNADGSYTIYFTSNKENETGLMSYDAAYVRITATDISYIALAEIDILAPTGDNVELIGDGFGKLASDFTYAEGNDEEGNPYVIPAGAILFFGEFKGDPAYNIVELRDQKNIILGGKQVILAPDPDKGQLGETSSGQWLYWFDTEEELAQFKDGKVTSVQAELYRVNNAITMVGERLTSNSLHLDLSETDWDNLPNVCIAREVQEAAAPNVVTTPVVETSAPTMKVLERMKQFFVQTKAVAPVESEEEETVMPLLSALVQQAGMGQTIRLSDGTQSNEKCFTAVTEGDSVAAMTSLSVSPADAVTATVEWANAGDGSVYRASRYVNGQLYLFAVARTDYLGDALSGTVKLQSSRADISTATLTAGSLVEVSSELKANEMDGYLGESGNTVDFVYTAKVGDKAYDRLEEAFAAAKTGETITVLRDIATNQVLNLADGRTLTLDLGGYTVTNAVTDGINITNGALTIQNGALASTAEGKMAVRVNGTQEKATLTVAETAKLSSQACVVYITGAQATLNTAGTLEANGIYAAIQGNGTNKYWGTTVSVTGGMISAPNSSAIYYPQVGTLNISGGTLMGQGTAVEQRAGTLNLTGGTLIATAESYEYAWNSNGSTISGAALALATHSTDQNITATIGNGVTLKGAERISVEPASRYNSKYTATITMNPVEAYVVDDGYYTVYTTLQDAITAVEENGTVLLAQDLTTTEAIQVNDGKTFTLDLGGYTVTNAVTDGINITNGALTIQNGTLATTAKGKMAVRVNGTQEKATLTVAETAKLSSQACVVYITGAQATLNTAGTLEANGIYAAIQGNGTNKYWGTTVSVTGGMISAPNSSAIYYPQVGTLNISGGTLMGQGTAVEQRAGTLNITGGTLIATAESYEYTWNSNGSTVSGAALALVPHSTNQDIVATISGGTFDGQKSIFVQEDDTHSQGMVDLTLTGGRFSEVDGLEEYLAKGYALSASVKDNDGYCPIWEMKGATIGDTFYATLEAALAAAQDGDTILLVGDQSGNGLQVAENRTVTVDFQGYTYTINGILMGSKGTETNGLQLLKNANVTLKNGTIQMGNTATKILVQNYSNLTLQDMVLNGKMEGGIACNYVLSNNCGTVQLLGDTSLIAANGKVALDVCVTQYYPNGTAVTVDTTGKIVGDITYSTWGNLPAENKVSLTINQATVLGELRIADALRSEAGNHLFILGGRYNSQSVSAYVSNELALSAADATGLYTVGGVYTVTWKNGSTTLETNQNVPYGVTPQFNGTLPENFCGWSPALAPVTEDVTYTARVKETKTLEAVTVEEGIASTKIDTTFGETVGEATIVVPVDGTAQQVELTMSEALLDSVAQSNSLTIGMTINGKTTTVKMEQKALQQVEDTAGDVTLCVQDITEDSALSTSLKDLTSRPVTKIFDFSLVDENGDKVAFEQGNMVVTVDYSVENEGLIPMVFYLSENNEHIPVQSSYKDGKLSFTTNHFSIYDVEEGLTVDYTLKAALSDADGHYNAGETVTLNVMVETNNAKESKLGSGGFRLTYDADKLELQSITPVATEIDNSDCNLQTASFGFTTKGGIAVDAEGVLLAQATFTVKSGISTGYANMSFSAVELTMSGYDNNTQPSWDEEGITANLHALKVTLKSGEYAVFADGTTTKTAFVKYGEAGLYEDADFNTALTLPTLTAKSGYRLAEAQWTDGTTLYADGNALQALTFEQDTTLTARTVAQYTVAFMAPTNGSYTVAELPSYTVDAGTKLSTLTLPEYSANEGYEFNGWADKWAGLVNIPAFTVNANMNLYPLFVAKQFDWATDVTGATVDNLTGVTENRVTYGNDVTFTVAPQENYVITGVSYSVNGGAAVSLTAEDGVYTITGSALLGNITLIVTAQQYYTVTFVANDNSTMDTTTLYFKAGEQGLYTDTTFETSANIPAPVANAGYRMAKDTAEEPLWLGDNAQRYTSSNIAEAVATLTGALTLTAQTVKTQTVTFVAGEHALLNGDVASVVYTVDQGQKLSETANAIPVVTAQDTGYVFDCWQDGNATVIADPANEVISEDVSYTAMMKGGSFAISASDTNAIVTWQSGVTAVVDESQQVIGYTATYLQDVTFTMVAQTDKRITAVKYQVGETEAVTVEADENGVYTITGTAILGTISILVEANDTYTVTFTNGENGTVSGQLTFTMDVNTSLTEADLAKVLHAGDAGYTFAQWQIGDNTYADATALLEALDCYNTHVTVTALFTHDTYVVVGVDGVNSATHGTDLTFIPAVAGKIVTAVSYSVDGGESGTLTANADGSYTLSGDKIIGIVTFTLETMDGSIRFIDNAQYKALTAETKIAVLETAKLSGEHYALEDGRVFYWSDRYNAYLRIVPVDTTAEVLMADLKAVSGDAIAISYTGDINGDGKTSWDDAGIVNDILHNCRIMATSDMYRLRCDVIDNSQTGAETVTADDVVFILQQANR